MRGDISLTYFEFTALAIFSCLACANLDVVILEVGLGGRLDAVNVIDTDCAIITSIDLDHTEWLGQTEVDALFAEQPEVEMACELCGAQYRFTQDSLAAVVRAGEIPH